VLLGGPQNTIGKNEMKTSTVKNTIFGLSIFWVAALFGISIFADVLAPYDPADVNVGNLLQAPSLEHWMGTDALGRDLLSRMIHGSRISLSVGLVAVAIALVLGILLGSIAGYSGHWVDRCIIALVDIMLSFPVLFLILAVVSIMESSLLIIMVIIGLTSWMGIARLIRAEILSLKEREFILAAKAMGASHLRILTRHLIPNAMGPVIVAATLGVAGAIMIESTLSFLGIGVQPPIPSWGNILMDAKAALGVAWWLMFYPGLAIFFTVLSYNFIGEHLRESMSRGVH